MRNITIFLSAVVFTFAAIYLQAVAVGWGTSASLAIATGFALLTLLLGMASYAIQHQRHKAAFRRKKKNADDTSTSQSRTIEIDLPFEAAFDLALDALETLDGEDIPAPTYFFLRSRQKLHIHTADREIGRIRAGLRAKTLGIQDITDFSRLEIQLQRLDDGTTRLRIDGEPSTSLEVYDLGRHMHYVNHLALIIRRESHAMSRASQRLSDDESAQETDSALGISTNTASDGQAAL